MDQRERAGDFQEAIRAALDGRQTRTWTALPGIIQSFDPDELTATVQPAIQGRVSDQQGVVTLVDLPLLLDCPVHFPSGGGVTLTFPITAGDECLVVFASRCIDAWWESGGVQAPLEARMHDLSDGFALVGFRSKPRALSPAPSTTAAELRADDGATVIQIDPVAQTLVLTAPEGVAVNADVVVNGDLLVTGSLQVDEDMTVKGDLLASGQVDLGGTGGALVQTVSGPATRVRAK